MQLPGACLALDTLSSPYIGFGPSCCSAHSSYSCKEAANKIVASNSNQGRGADDACTMLPGCAIGTYHSMVAHKQA